MFLEVTSSKRNRGNAAAKAFRLRPVECLREEECARQLEIEWEEEENDSDTYSRSNQDGDEDVGEKVRSQVLGSDFARAVELERLCWTLYARQLSPSVS